MDDFDEELDATPFINVLKQLCSKGRDENSMKVAAVTSALVEVIQEKLGASSFEDITPAALFASALNALSSTVTSDSADSSSSPQHALMVIIMQITPYVSTSNPNLYLHQFATLSRSIRGVVASLPSSTGQDQSKISAGWNSLLRQCIRTASTSINGIIVLDNAKSAEKEVLKCFHSCILQHFDDPRPKVRRQAHSSVLELLQVSNSLDHTGLYSLIPNRMIEYAHHIMLAFTKQSEKQKRDNDFSKKEKVVMLLHLLSFLESSIPFFDIRGRLGLAGELMNLYSFAINNQVDDSNNNVMVANGALAGLLQVFDNANRETESANEKIGDEDAFCAQSCALLLQSNVHLLRCTSNTNEGIGNCRIQYTRCVVETSLRLLSENIDDGQRQIMKNLVPKLLPLSVAAIVNCIDDNINSESGQSISAELSRLIRSKGVRNLVENESQLEGECIDSCIAAVQKILHHRFRSHWDHLMPCLASLVITVFQGMIPVTGANEAIMSRTIARVTPLISGLVQVYADVDDPSSKGSIEDALGDIVQGVGIEYFLGFVNLGVSTKESSIMSGAVSNERAWIIGVIKSSLSNGVSPYHPHLAFFQSHILGLARQCDAASAAGNLTSVEASIQRSRVVDLWSLFPSFCVNTTDIELTFPSLAQTVVRAMSDKRYPQLMNIICTGLTKLALDVRAKIDDNQDKLDSDIRILSEYSTKILPALFKLVETLNGVGVKDESREPSEEMEEDDEEDKKKFESSGAHHVTNVTDTIAAFAPLAPEEFLKGLFKKIVQRLLVATQSKQDETEKVCTLLNLAGALVKSGSLNEDSITLLYRAVKPLIRSDELNSRVQKRAYKIFAEICLHYNSFVVDPERLKEILDLLVGSTLSLQISARYMRLKCIQLIVEGFEKDNSDHMDKIPNIVGETLLCLKDANHKTRESAYQLLISMARVRNDMTAYFHVIVGALGAQTSHMRSAAVMALSRLVFEFAREDLIVQSLLPHILQTVIVLFDENSREVTKSVVGFVRVSIAALQKEQLEPLLPAVVGGMMKFNRGRGRFRQKIKIILKRLVKTFGYERITPLVPEADFRLITHMRKLAERSARRKASNFPDGQTEMGDFEDMMESDEEDSDDGRTFMTGVSGFTKLTSGTQKTTKSIKTDEKSMKSMNKSMMSSKSKASIGPRLDTSGEKSGDILDMLDTNLNKNVRFAPEDDDYTDSDDEAMEFDGSGKLVIGGDDSSVDDEEVDLDMEPEGKKQKISKFESAKATRDSSNLQKNKKKQQDQRDNRILGSAYKSNKAGGDVRKKNQVYEPYAFVPLEGRNFSKKNRGKSVEQMSSVVRQGGKRKRR